MTNAMKAFLELASRDKKLHSQLKGLRVQEEKEAREQVISLAADNGIRLCEEDFIPEAREIDEEELDAVAGGACCFCVAAGGGAGGEKEAFVSNNCVCLLGGAGDGTQANQQNPYAPQKKDRCTCILAGQGDDFGL